MKILPAAVQQRVDRFDRQQSLIIAISTGLVALWSLYRAGWALYLTFTYNFLFGTLVFQVALWAVIGAVAGIAAYAFYTRYTKASDTPK